MRVACLHTSVSTQPCTTRSLQTIRSLRSWQTTRTVGRPCIRCSAAVPDEPSVSDALSKTTAVFTTELAQGETPSIAKQRATLTRELDEAVAAEDYATAASLRDALLALDASDPVARLKTALQAAIEEERFSDAATLRDELKAALQSTTNLAEIPVSSDTVTRNIRVRVKSFYVPQQSSPTRGLYFFAYSITITNEGEQTVMLRNRHWLITDEEGQTEDVRYCVWVVVVCDTSDVWDHLETSPPLVHNNTTIDRGAGVVGAQPILNPGESFQYSSACPLRTPIGSMQGEYEFAVLDASGEWGEVFEVEIGRFGLNVEHKLSTVGGGWRD